MYKHQDTVPLEIGCQRMNFSLALEGETALITGGGSGLGLGMARCMAPAGAKVILVGRREVLEALLRRQSLGIDSASPRPRYHRLRRRRRSWWSGVDREIQPVSILVNNAGIHLKKPAVETTPEISRSSANRTSSAAHNLTSPRSCPP